MRCTIGCRTTSEEANIVMLMPATPFKTCMAWSQNQDVVRRGKSTCVVSHSDNRRWSKNRCRVKNISFAREVGVFGFHQEWIKALLSRLRPRINQVRAISMTFFSNYLFNQFETEHFIQSMRKEGGRLRVVFCVNRRVKAQFFFPLPTLVEPTLCASTRSAPNAFKPHKQPLNRFYSAPQGPIPK